MLTIQRRFLIAGGAVLVCSLAINAILISEFEPLLPYYQSYWNLRGWVSRNLLGVEHPDESLVYHGTDFVMQTSQLPSPKYQIDDVLRAEDPVTITGRIQDDIRSAFALDRIPRGPLNFQSHSSTPHDSYSLGKVSYQTQDGIRIPAYLMEPVDSAPWAAVLVIHGCGYGKAGPAGAIEDMHSSLGVELVQAGFLVLVPDRRGFGELQPVDRYVWPNCDGSGDDARLLLEKDARVAFNTDLRSLDVFDLLVAVDYLNSRHDVTSVGVVGLSGGGVVASHVAGQSEKVAAVVLSNSLSYRSGVPESYQAHRLKVVDLPETPLARLQLETLRTPPGLSALADNLSLISLALLSPRPILIQYGDQDTVNYLQGGEEAIELVRDLYGRHGAAENVAVSIEPGGHEIFPESIIKFFNTYLIGR